MAVPSVETVSIRYCCNHMAVPMGRLALKDRNIYFEYSPSFFELGLELSPFKLPLKPGVTTCSDKIFEGLFGVFNDSLPDGWGRLLLDRKLMNLGINPGSLSPLDRLCYVGSRAMGALQYEPEIENPISTTLINDLDLIHDECIAFQEHDEDQFVDDLLVMNGSSSGARPKILISLINKEKKFEISNNNLLRNHNDWIIKFKSSLDPKDIGPIEYAYHLMALEAGLDVPEARLFKSKKCKGYFGVKRFDRQGNKLYHMHTVSGLLHVDHRIPSLDYETLMRATLWLTKDVRECEKQFGNAVFNVLTHNRDDHAKNFSFLMDERGYWRVSPAYDLNFSSGPQGEHSTTIMGEGKNPSILHFLKLAEIGSIKKQKALEIIDHIKGAVSKWNAFADEAQVGLKSSKNIEMALEKISRCIKSSRSL